MSPPPSSYSRTLREVAPIILRAYNFGIIFVLATIPMNFFIELTSGNPSALSVWLHLFGFTTSMLFVAISIDMLRWVFKWNAFGSPPPVPPFLMRLMGRGRWPTEWPDDSAAYPSFVCPQCRARSFNETDIQHRYCARCHVFWYPVGEELPPMVRR